MTVLATSPVAGTGTDEQRDTAGESVVVSAWTAISRITGLAKLAAIAAVLGPTYMGNAFHAMNLLPTAAYEFLTGSLLVNLLVPHLANHLRRGAEGDAARVAGGVLGRAILAFGGLIAVLMIARPAVLAVFTAGVSDPIAAAAQRDAGSLLLMLMLPQILLYAVAGIAGSVLNAKGRFGLVAAAPAFENLGIIATIATSAVLFGSQVRDLDASRAVLVVLGGGATVAVALHAGALWFACRRAGITLLPRFEKDADVRAILAAAPATIGQAGLNALRTITGLVVANAVAGGVVAFQFAMTFFYLPSALGAKAVGVPVLRRLAHAFDDRDEAGFRRQYTNAFALTAFIVVPAAFAYLALATPIVRSVAFGEIATAHGIGMVAVALTALAPGVLAEASFLLGSYGAYARRDARTPLRAMAIRTAITVYGMIAAAEFLEGRSLILALALAVSVGNVIAAARLAIEQRRWMPSHAITPSLLRTVIASVAMVAAALPVAVLLSQSRDNPTWTGAVTVVVGIATYLGVHRALGSPELASLLGIGRRNAADSEGDDAGEVLQTDRGQLVTLEGDVVYKRYAGADAERRAQREYDHLGRVWAAMRERTGITCPQPLDISLGEPPVLRMTRVPGIGLDTYLREPVAGDELWRIAHRLAVALEVYVDATDEPYVDLHLRNTLLDPTTHDVAIVDFDAPAHLSGAPSGRPRETSIGNLVGSTVFESVRPRNVLGLSFARSCLQVCRVVLDHHSDLETNDLATAARMKLDATTAHGGIARRAWYLALRPVARRRLSKTLRSARRTTPEERTPSAPVQAPAAETLPIPAERRAYAADPTRVVIGAVAVTTLLVAVAAAVTPILAVLIVGAIACALAVAVHPPLVAYALLFLTPLVVGLNRESVLPVLRVNEAIVLLGGAALAVRGIVLWIARGRITRVRIGRLESAFALLLITGSVLPLVWLAARGLPIARDDFLYALVLWKLIAVYIVVRAAVRTEAEVRRCLWISMASVGVVAVIGIAQSVDAFGVPAFLARFFAPEGLTSVVMNNRATSTIGNAIAFGDVMAVHAAIAGAFLLRGHRRRVILACACALFTIAALASGQLSGVIALMLAFAAVSFVTRRGFTLAVAALPVAILAVFLLRPVVEQRLERVDPTTGIPQSWSARQDNLETYFLPSLREPAQAALGVRPAARVPAHEGWRDWVYIESGYVWVLWTGGIPFLFAIAFYLSRAYRSTVAAARYRFDGVGVASVGVIAALAITAVLMLLDPHFTMRGTADATFALLALATATTGWRILAHEESA